MRNELIRHGQKERSKNIAIKEGGGRTERDGRLGKRDSEMDSVEVKR